MISKAEIVGSLRPTYTLSNATLNIYLSQAARNGLLKRVRRGVYISPEVHDRMVIACESVKDGYLAFHTALEYYGLSEEEYSSTQIASVNRFRPFEYDFVLYERVPELENQSVCSYIQPEGTVRCTSITRTLLDCIDRPDLCAGHEAIWNAFLLLKQGEIDFQELSSLLSKRNNKSLYQRVGYYCDHFSKRIETPQWFLQECRSNSNNVVSSTGYPGELVYDSSWRLSVPHELQEDAGRDIVRYMTTEQKKSVLFLSGIIEYYKAAHNLTAMQVLERFEQNDVMSWLENNWEVLHTVSVDYVIEEIDGLLDEK